MIDRLRTLLEEDEGISHEIYWDHLGIPTIAKVSAIQKAPCRYDCGRLARGGSTAKGL